jgi:N-acetylmuramoyl-L-alanine amidase
MKVFPLVLIWTNLILLGLAPSLVLAAGTPRLFQIVIDPGHGGVDQGAVRGSAQEAHIALQVALQLKDILNSTGTLQAQLTRVNNKTVSLQERVQMADFAQADLVVSIHANANADARAKGVEIYFQNHLPPDEETLYLADSEKTMWDTEVLPTSEASRSNDISAIIEDLHRQHRMHLSRNLSFDILQSFREGGSKKYLSVKQAPFYMIARPKAPSVLVELGFVTNPKEAQLLTQPEFQKQSALKIAKGLQNFIAHQNSAQTFSIPEKK